MNIKSTQVELQAADSLLQSLKEINKKITKDIEEMKLLQEQEAYAIARIQGKIEDKAALVQLEADSLLIKSS
jgi:hypothetical protein